MTIPSETAGPAVSTWPILSLQERRVLGVLVEKAKTTPDAYPLSLNALVTGCNQKSNRDPLLSLDEAEVEDTLLKLQKHQLAIKIVGGRVERWRHALYDAWTVNKVELAVLGELLLRGPQTEGELRGRASRMEPIDDLDSLRPVLCRLAERRLIVYLTPEGRRGTILTHGFHAAEELDHLRARYLADAPADDSRVTSPLPAPTQADDRMPALEAQLAEVRETMASLRGELADLQATVAALAGQLRSLKDALGA